MARNASTHPSAPAVGAALANTGGAGVLKKRPSGAAGPCTGMGDSAFAQKARKGLPSDCHRRNGRSGGAAASQLRSG
jgi:hypothetical protein